MSENTTNQTETIQNKEIKETNELNESLIENNENIQSTQQTETNESNEIKETNENKDEKDEENKIEIVEIVKSQPKPKLSIFTNGKNGMITILLVIKEKIQQSIDLSFRLISIPIEYFKKIMQKPIPRKIVIGISTVSIVGISVYALGYIPYQHVVQSKQLKF